MTSIDKINRGATTIRTERRRALRELDPSLHLPRVGVEHIVEPGGGPSDPRAIDEVRNLAHVDAYRCMEVVRAFSVRRAL